MCLDQEKNRVDAYKKDSLHFLVLGFIITTAYIKILCGSGELRIEKIEIEQ